MVKAFNPSTAAGSIRNKNSELGRTSPESSRKLDWLLLLVPRAGEAPGPAAQVVEDTIIGTKTAVLMSEMMHRNNKLGFSVVLRLQLNNCVAVHDCWRAV